VAGLLERANAIRIAAEDYFGHVTVANTCDVNGKVISAPTFAGVQQDPIRSIFLGSPFHVEAGLVPHLRFLGIKVVEVSFSESQARGHTSLNYEALHHNDVAFGSGAVATYDSHGVTAFKMRVYCNNIDENAQSTVKKDGGEGPLFSGVLDEETYRILNNAPKPQGLRVFSKIEKWGDLDDGEIVRCLSSTVPPYDVLNVLQRAGLSQNRFTWLRGTSQKGAIPRENPVNMDGFIELYANRSEVRKVFDALQEAAATRNASFGISHQLAQCLVDGVQQINVARENDNPGLFYLYNKRPTLSNGTVGEAPEYFQRFWKALDDLTGTWQSEAKESWLNKASAALTDLETSLSAYVNR